MKRYDPAYLRLLELLPESAADVRYLSIEVRDPGHVPFVGHLPLTRRDDLPPELGDELRARMAARVREAAGEEPPPGAARAFVGLPLVARARREPAPGRARAPRRAVVRARRRRGVVGRRPRRSRSRRRCPGGGRAHLVHHHVPGVNDYSQRLTLHCSDRVLELTFPSPYLLHQPTRLVEIRSDGAARTAQHRPPRLLRGGVPGGAAGVLRRLRGPRSGGDARRGRARRHRAPARRLRPRACPRDRGVCCALTRRNRRWSCRGHASAAARSRA